MNHPKLIRPFVVVVAALALLAASCGDDDSDASSPSDEGEDTTAVEEDHEEGEFEFGVPADAGDATRVIEIQANDDFSFDPDQVDVEVGETVTFRVTNAGNLEHDFTLGDAEVQDQHEAEMNEMDEEMADTAEMDMGATHDEPNAMSLASGATEEMTWTFTEAGEIIFGCHTAGHYEAGMHGDIAIADAS